MSSQLLRKYMDIINEKVTFGPDGQEIPAFKLGPGDGFEITEFEGKPALYDTERKIHIVPSHNPRAPGSVRVVTGNTSKYYGFDQLGPATKQALMKSGIMKDIPLSGTGIKNPMAPAPSYLEPNFGRFGGLTPK